MLSRVSAHRQPWDMVIIGGGATGVGCAVDAASRGYDVLLLEQSDFGKGTSSRSTKLVHGGVRYLRQGNITLVRQALKERSLLRQNAPHLVQQLAFVIPNYRWWEAPFYGLGLKLYNVLAGEYGFGPSTILSRAETLQRLPTIKAAGLRGGVVYYDGQFDDSRLLINLVVTAVEQGGTLVNYAQVIEFTRDHAGVLNGVVVRDVENGGEFRATAKVVINATGAFCDALRGRADGSSTPLIAPSQGIHLVFDRSFLPGDSALMVPRTSDGRVMFALPWQGHTLVGTTDTPINEVVLEPTAEPTEINFLLKTAAQYLSQAPTREDICSTFTGIRPLVSSGGATRTASLSRDHTLRLEPSGLLTITGGKWTTYRRMAEDCINRAAALAGLAKKPCLTATLHIHGYHEHAEQFGSLAMYGVDAPAIRELIRADRRLGEPLHPALPYCNAEVIWATRNEMARTVEDVLARRTHALPLKAHAAMAMAPRVARLMARELGHDVTWQEEQVRAFTTLAQACVVAG